MQEKGSVVIISIFSDRKLRHNKNKWSHGKAMAELGVKFRFFSLRMILDQHYDSPSHNYLIPTNLDICYTA